MAANFSPRLRHPGTGREAMLVCADEWLDGEPIGLAGMRYILLAGSERLTSTATGTARRWIDAGASYICAWGPSSDDTEEAFDYASFLEDVGTPLTFTLMTTSHRDQALEEALWFAFYNARSPDDLPDSLDTVVIVVDKPALAQVCEAWVRDNRE